MSNDIDRRARPPHLQIGIAGAIMFGAIGAVGLILTYQGYASSSATANEPRA